MAKKTFAYAVLEGVAQEMRKDPNLSLCYQFEVPIARLPTGETLDLAKEFGTPRTSGRWGWPIDEAWYAGWATGMALTGCPAIARIPFQAAIFPAEFVCHQIGKLRSMSGGEAHLPLVLWIGGAGRRPSSAGQHTDVGEEAFYAYLPGLKVVVPSNAYDAKGLMIAAIRDPDPVVFRDYGEARIGQQPDVPDEAYEVPIGKAAVRQEGKDLTLVAWAPATVEVPRALTDLAQEGLSVEFFRPEDHQALGRGYSDCFGQEDRSTAGGGSWQLHQWLRLSRGSRDGAAGAWRKGCPNRLSGCAGSRREIDDDVDAAGRSQDRRCRQEAQATMSAETAHCPRCDQPMRSAIVKTAIWAGERLVIVEDIPAQVCDSCVEQFYDEETTNALRGLTEDGFPQAEAEREMIVQVFSLGPRSAKMVASEKLDAG